MSTCSRKSLFSARRRLQSCLSEAAVGNERLPELVRHFYAGSALLYQLDLGPLLDCDAALLDRLLADEGVRQEVSLKPGLKRFLKQLLEQVSPISSKALKLSSSRPGTCTRTRCTVCCAHA